MRSYAAPKAEFGKYFAAERKGEKEKKMKGKIQRGKGRG